MSDIVERLNDEELWGSSSDRFHLRKDAIAEIERLRAALREIADLSSVSVRAPHIARAALEEKP